jgi:hypothetical protein
MAAPVPDENVQQRVESVADPPCVGPTIPHHRHEDPNRSVDLELLKVPADDHVKKSGFAGGKFVRNRTAKTRQYVCMQISSLIPPQVIRDGDWPTPGTVKKP